MKVGLVVLSVCVATAQEPIDRQSLASYRLTVATFRQFQDASEAIARVVADDQALRDAPLFSKDVVQAGDVLDVARGLAARLREHHGLAAALASARLSADGYARFTLALIAARMAYGFLESGVLRAVPPGAPSANVSFVRTHVTEIDAALLQLGIAL